MTVDDNCTVPVKSIASIMFAIAGGTEKLITCVLYVPYLCKNLLSISQMAKHKMSALSEDGTKVVRSKDIGNLVAKGAEEYGLYR